MNESVLPDPADGGSGAWPPPRIPVPGDPPFPEHQRGSPPRLRARPWWLALAVVAGLLAATVLVAALVPVDRYAVAPGDARPVEPRVDIEGDVETYPGQDDLLFVTVSVPKLSALGAFVAWLDPDTDVKTADELFPDETREENRERNLQRMRYSKDLATYVALSRLGYDVEVEGGGPVVESLCMEGGFGEPCRSSSPADAVLDPGDAIVELDGEPVNLVEDIAPILLGRSPGEVVPATVDRDGERLDVELELTRAEDGRTIIGIVPSGEYLDAVEFQLPFEVAIDSGEVGGPSAGLAFALTLIDLLSPGEITGGRKVAATGEILVDGRVGAIGGLHQKTTAVKASGADVFLVPAQQLAEAEAEAEGSELEVIGVETLDDALVALERIGGDLAGVPPRTA